MMQLQQENYKLRRVSNSHLLDWNRFLEEEFKFYTSLQNCKVFNVLLESIKEDHCGEKVLLKFHPILLTLMRLRLNFPNQHLAYRFDVLPGTVSRIFHNVLGIMYKKLVCLLVFWSEREQLQQSMPMCFRKSFP